MTDNRTTELCNGLRDVGNLHEFAELFGFNWHDDSDWTWHDVAVRMADELEQVIAATLGRLKAKAHPYGYESDTGAFDCTRCECGCINDISATYCNDCGGEIEIDESAEKEIYHHPRNSVFAEKHDDGSLEFGGKRYIAATLGSERHVETCVPAWSEGLFYCDCGANLDESANYCGNCGARVLWSVLDGPNCGGKVKE